MKKKLLTLLIAVLPLMAWADSSGTWGSNLTWTYVEDTQTLIISGTGATPAYTNKTASKSPFYNNENIKSVIFEEGITELSPLGLAYCDNLTSVTIPNSMKTIQYAAFAFCI